RLHPGLPDGRHVLPGPVGHLPHRGARLRRRRLRAARAAGAAHPRPPRPSPGVRPVRAGVLRRRRDRPRGGGHQRDPPARRRPAAAPRRHGPDPPLRRRSRDGGARLMLVTAIVILLFALLLIRVPVGFAIGIAGVAGLLAHGGTDLLLGLVSASSHTAVSAYTLSAIPLFILMAQFVLKSGVAADLFAAARAWTGGVRGGLGVATAGAGALFAAISGSSTAAAATLATTSTREMTAA